MGLVIDEGAITERRVKDGLPPWGSANGTTVSESGATQKAEATDFGHGRLGQTNALTEYRITQVVCHLLA